MLPVTRSWRNSVLAGVTLGLSLHLVQVGLRFVLPQTVVYIGLTQWLYLVPVMLLCPGLRRGLLIAGALTFLVNAVAYGVMYWLFFVPH